MIASFPVLFCVQKLIELETNLIVKHWTTQIIASLPDNETELILKYFLFE